MALRSKSKAALVPKKPKVKRKLKAPVVRISSGGLQTLTLRPLLLEKKTPKAAAKAPTKAVTTGPLVVVDNDPLVFMFPSTT